MVYRWIYKIMFYIYIDYTARISIQGYTATHPQWFLCVCVWSIRFSKHSLELWKFSILWAILCKTENWIFVAWHIFCIRNNGMCGSLQRQRLLRYGKPSAIDCVLYCVHAKILALCVTRQFLGHIRIRMIWYDMPIHTQIHP